MSLDTEYVRLGDTWDPVVGTLPSGVLTTDEISNSKQSFTSEATYGWNDSEFKFNNIGQKWKADIKPTWSGPDAYGGVKNCATPRRFSAPAAGMSNQFFASVTEFEILFTGTKLSIRHMNLGGDGSGTEYGGDTQIQVECHGEMYRVADLPKTTTRTDGYSSYRNLVFAAPVVNARIKFRFGNIGFMSLHTDGDAIVAPAPPRPMGPLDGDSYVESTQALCADSVSQHFTTGIAYYMGERTGWNIPERGQGATGFFSNGAALVSDDTVGSASQYILFIEITVTGLTRWFSGGGTANINSRLGWITNAAGALEDAEMSPFVNYAGEDFGQPLGRRPITYTIFGTWNDASVGGVTFDQMYTRAKACYEALHAIDPYCTIIHVSPEPFDDGLFGDVLGPPRRGDKSDIHVRAQMKAASEVPNVYYVNAFGPEDPWWTGMGSEEGGTQGIPTSSQQAQMVSKVDGIHYRREGGRYLANKVCDAIADIPVLRARVNGLV
ncbi:MAG: hypothetical protein U5N53_28265 [Mycobacterium sp.]|nr:hypothetical protein [Mycobacterium sp.]